ETFAFKFKDEPRLKIPKGYREYSTSMLLVMEYVPGITLDKVIKDVSEDDSYNKIVVGEFEWDRRELTEELADILSRQVLDVGFFHADPHPANILLTTSGQICLLDFGIVGSVSKELMKGIRETLIAVSSGDTEK